MFGNYVPIKFFLSADQVTAVLIVHFNDGFL